MMNEQELPKVERGIPSAGEFLLVFALYTGIALFYWWPMLADPDAVWSVGRDFFQNTWNLWWVDHALANGKPVLETDRLFHPEGTSLAFHTISLANSIPGWFLQQKLGLSLGTTYVVLFVSSFPLAAAGAWALARYLSGSAAAAFTVGVFYAFNPYHTAMVPQLNNVQFHWLPLALLSFLCILDRRGWWAVAVCAFCTAMSGYVDWYQPVFLAMAMAVLFAMRAWRERALPHLGTWVQLATAGLLALLMLVPGLLPMFSLLAIGEGPTGHDPPIRFASDAQLLGMKPKGAVSLVAWPVILGWTTTFLLLWTFIRARKAVAPGWWALAVIAFVLVLGPRLMVLGRELPVPLPMAAFPNLPLFEYVRVPHRFLLLLFLALCGVLARGLRELEDARGSGIVAVCGLLLAFEMQPAPPEPVALTVAPVYQVLAESEEDFAVLELPLDLRDGYPMFLQTRHGKKLLAGYTSHILPSALAGLESDLLRALLPAHTDTDILGLPGFLEVDVAALDEETLAAWRRELVLDKDVRYIVLRKRPDFAPGEGAAKPETAMAKLKVALTPFRFNSGSNDLQRQARALVGKFRSALIAENSQAEALVRRLFGEPSPGLGSLQTRVWDLSEMRIEMLRQGSPNGGG